MNLADARSHITNVARNAGSSVMYSAGQIDQALQFVGQDFCRETRALVITTAFSLTADLGFIQIVPTNITSVPLPGLMPENVMDISVGPSSTNSGEMPTLKMVDYPDFLRQVTRDGGASNGAPEIGAIANTADDPAVPGGGFTINFYPINDFDARAMYVRLWLPFRAWTIGTAASNVTSFNLPDQWLFPILDGAAARLQINEPEHRYSQLLWQQYVTFRDRMKSAGSLAIRLAEREMMQ